ncbi:DEAD/DEAH box helicase family protein [Ammonicoccus fulvus]|uniref:DEAD/DEAH box helicase family protein n=1 Tax=Ammonicoccus fulvus TaxID=3138240 RepID=A0ABZ3FVS1_9ACTN
MAVEITYDEALIEEIAARFDLRDPNKNALAAVVQKIADGGSGLQEMVADLATGVGKTFLMSSLIEYLAQQGVRHVLVVTPGSTIQRKTLANFDAASHKYVAGADIAPFIVTPDNFQAANVGSVLRDPKRLKVFVFNVQQLIRPTDKVSRKVRDEDENLGDALYSHLTNADDLFVIADEHHVYREKAKAFSAAIRDLGPVALVGLTATPDKADYAKVIFQYTLGEAIADGHVKVPVIVYRKDGTKDERTQLQDACQLLGHKEKSYEVYRQTSPDAPAVNPVLFVVCQTIEHATEVGQLLAQPGMIGDGSQVLEITSQSSDEALEALSKVEEPDSPIRAIVSVNMLREGWDVKNIAVIVALRRLASQTLTEQILGRGLRLPFGQRTGVADVDQVDLVAHDSYQQLLSQKDVLRQRIQLPSTAVEVDDQGFATSAEVDPNQPVPVDPGTGSPEPGQVGGAGGSSSLTPAPGQWTLFELEDESAQDEDYQPNPGLIFEETEQRVETKIPEPQYRVDGAPQIIFPRRESRLVHSPFSLSDIPDGDAEKAGVAFIKEVPTFIFRDALEAKRKGDQVQIISTPQGTAEAQQTLAGLDVVHEELTAAIMQQPEVPAEKASKNAAKRLVKAFLKGAGVTSDDETAEWGTKRRQQAVEGMRSMIRDKITNRPRQESFEFVGITLPLEPVTVEPDAPMAHNVTKFKKGLQYVGWKKNVMPMATFDAGTTEWQLALLMDRDPNIQWWVRIYTNGQAFIRTTDGYYFPDFIALDTDGTYWLIEGKADDHAKDDSVLRKKKAAEDWARAVRDEDDFGTWRYMFATESDIKQAGGSWNALLTSTKPE